MKIILINPYFESHIITPPLGLGYLSSYLKKKSGDVSVSIIDCLANNINETRLVETIVEEKPDLVGLTVYSTFYENSRDIVRDIKKKNKNVLIVLGGPHASALPEFVLQDTGADFVIFGE